MPEPRKIKKILKRILFSLLGLFLVLFILAFLFKGWLLDYAVSKARTKLKDKYHLDLTFKSYSLHGFTEVNTEGLFCKTENNDTFVFLNTAKLKVHLLPILAGNIHLSDVFASNGIIKLQYLKLLKKKKVDKPIDSADKFSRIKRYAGVIESLADFLPENLEMHKINFLYNTPADNISMAVNSITYKDEKLDGDFFANLNGDKQQWKLSGNFNKNDITGNFSFKTAQSGYVNINRIKRKVHFDFALHELDIELRKFENGDEDIKLEGKIAGKGLELYNPKVSKDTILVNEGALDYRLDIDTAMISLDSSSYIDLNGLVANIGIYSRYKAPKDIKICMNMAPVEAQKFLNALPDATFDKVKTMKLDGSLKYHLGFYLSIPKYDSVYFNSSFIGENLKAKDYGIANLNKINGTFTYIPYGSNRHIIIGPENPSFANLDTIAKNLRDAVINSEDGDFFWNKGFNQEAFGKSIVENLKTHSFKKGGSTITQQLVKNVFLSRKKTIDRKLEEALITWMIENLHIAGKKRIYEVYLNIIEWGPDVYGIGEASRFYFNKHPSQLTLKECVFLGMIIPSPKNYMYYFDGKGHLRKNAQGYYNLITSKLVAYSKMDKSLIDTIPFDVKLAPSAQKYLRIKDTTELPPSDDEIQWNDLLIGPPPPPESKIKETTISKQEPVVKEAPLTRKQKRAKAREERKKRKQKKEEEE